MRLQRPRARVYKGLRSPVRAGRPRVLLVSVHRIGTIATAHAALSGRIGTIAPAAIAVADSLRFLEAWHVAGARAGGSASAHSCTSIRLRFASFRDWMQCTKMPPNASRVQRLQPQRHMWYCIAPPGFLLLGTCGPRYHGCGDEARVHAPCHCQVAMVSASASDGSRRELE